MSPECHAMCMLQQMAGGGALSSNKKQREVYVGNLTIGVVADVMLRELFNGALAHLVPDPVANPPVVNAQLDPSGMRPSRHKSFECSVPSVTKGRAGERGGERYSSTSCEGPAQKTWLALPQAACRVQRQTRGFNTNNIFSGCQATLPGTVAGDYCAV